MASWLLIFLLIITLAGEAAKSACPSLCKCYPVSPVGKVNCTYAHLAHIPWNLPDPAGLKSLDLGHNLIRAIIADIVWYSNLEYLDLSNNELQTVDDYVFKSLPKLKHLYLSRNKITIITEHTFSNLRSLIRLDLSGNHISALRANVFKDLGSLEELDLSLNRLQTLPSGSFNGLTSVKNISLSSNRLYNLSRDWWSGCTSVDTLLLDMNSITEVPDSAFQLVPNLLSLSMEGNSLNHIHPNAFFTPDLSSVRHGPMKSKAVAPTIEELSLKHNNLEVIPSELLQKLTNLVTLDLSQNAITVIDPDAFKNMVKLQRMYLNALPKLQVIRSFSFSELLSLQYLEISSNTDLHEIEKNTFLGTPNLLEIDLHNNALTTLDSNLLDWRKLAFLDLRNNPWNCDCSLGYLGEVLRDKKNQSAKSGYVYSDVICSSPKSHQGIPVLKLSSDCISIELPPKNNPSDNTKKYSDKIIIAVICMFALCFVSCLFVLVWRTRKISFNTAESNIPPRTRRLRRRQRIIANGNAALNIKPDHTSKSNSLDKISITENMDEENLDEDHDVFCEDGISHCSETESQKNGQAGHIRKVSFSNYVQVRRCSFDSNAEATSEIGEC